MPTATANSRRRNCARTFPVARVALVAPVDFLVVLVVLVVDSADHREALAARVVFQEVDSADRKGGARVAKNWPLA